MNQVTTTLPIEVRTPDPSTLNAGQPDSGSSAFCLDFISSDATTDRYCESISPTGWKLDNYRRNPVFQNSHQYGDILFTLGKALITEVRDVVGRGVPTAPALFQRIAFACDVNPMAKIAYGLYKGEFLNAVSVGFIPIRWQDLSSSCSSSTSRSTGRDDFHVVPISAAGDPSGSQPSTLNSQPRRRFLEQELLEVSAVAIPANPNALALAYKSGAVAKSDLTELSILLRCTLSAQSSGTQPSALNPQREFLRSLHSVLRKI